MSFAWEESRQRDAVGVNRFVGGGIHVNKF